MARELKPEKVQVYLSPVSLAAEVDERWSFVGTKKQQRWLWHAIDHTSGKILAYVFGRRHDKAFLKLQKLLSPFGITKYYTDHWATYYRHIEFKKHFPGKHCTQKIERKHLLLRTRLKTISKEDDLFLQINRNA